MSGPSAYGKGDRSRAKIGKEIDMGSLGCKKGWHVYRGGECCFYCKVDKKKWLDDLTDEGQKLDMGY